MREKYFNYLKIFTNFLLLKSFNSHRFILNLRLFSNYIKLLFSAEYIESFNFKNSRNLIHKATKKRNVNLTFKIFFSIVSNKNSKNIRPEGIYILFFVLLFTFHLS